MKSFFKQILQYKLFILRNIIAPFGLLKEVTILCYHSIDDSGWSVSVSPKIFSEQMYYLKRKGYYFASLDEIVAYKRREINLPRKTVAITFDDGYESVYKKAFTILKKLNAPMALFLVSNFDESRMCRGTSLNQLSNKDLEIMLASGLVQTYHHSKTHRMLDTLTVEEIKQELEVEMGTASYFAYPGGHHSGKVLALVRAAGFKAAFGIGAGLIRQAGEPFLIKRNVILGTMTSIDFRVRTTKAIDWYMYITHLIHKI